MSAPWSEDAIRALGVQTDIRTAGSIFGMSYTTAKQLARAGEFPVPVLRIGGRWMVPVAPILRALGLTHDEQPVADVLPLPGLVTGRAS